VQCNNFPCTVQKKADEIGIFLRFGKFLGSFKELEKRCPADLLSVVMPRERAADAEGAPMRDCVKLAKSELSDHRPGLSRGHAAGITTIGVDGSLKVAA